MALTATPLSLSSSRTERVSAVINNSRPPNESLKLGGGKEFIMFQVLEPDETSSFVRTRCSEACCNVSHISAASWKPVIILHVGKYVHNVSVMYDHLNRRENFSISLCGKCIQRVWQLCPGNIYLIGLPQFLGPFQLRTSDRPIRTCPEASEFCLPSAHACDSARRARPLTLGFNKNGGQFQIKSLKNEWTLNWILKLIDCWSQ